MDSDNPKAPDTVGPGDSSSSGSTATDVPTPWWRPTRKHVIAWVSFVMTAAVIPIIVNIVSSGITKQTPPTARTAAPQATSTKVTEAAGEQQYSGPHGYGWAASPVILKNDYVSVEATMKPDDECNGATGWVFRQSPTKLAPLTSYNPNDWAIRNGGIPQSGNYITLDVQALNGHTVIIDTIGVKVISRAAPPSGTAAILSGGCGGLTPSLFRVNLDQPGLQVRPVDGVDITGKKIPPIPLPHVVTETGPEQWRLQILTATCDCTFVPYFTWSSDGSAGTFEITDGSGPWQVASAAKAHPAERFPSISPS